MVYVLVLYLIFKVHFTPLLSHISRFFANFGGIFLTTENFAHIVQHLCFWCFGITQNDLTTFYADTFFLLCFVGFLLHISPPHVFYSLLREFGWMERIGKGRFCAAKWSLLNKRSLFTTSTRENLPLAKSRSICCRPGRFISFPV